MVATSELWHIVDVLAPFEVFRRPLAWWYCPNCQGCHVQDRRTGAVTVLKPRWLTRRYRVLRRYLARWLRRVDLEYPA